jgi:hypothetical protein
VIAVVGQPYRVVGRHEHAVRARKQTFAERAQEVSVAVEYDHRMLAAIEDVDVVVPVDADVADLLERPARWELRPVLDGLVRVVAAADDRHAHAPAVR